MSRGFVKEGDQEEIPLVAPRAHLPNGVTNYVTPNGLKELKQEQVLLRKELVNLQQLSTEDNRIQINYIKTKLRLLDERVNSAKLVELSDQPQNEIHFGATVTLYKIDDGCECKYQIVGVDEANISANKVSFLSPIAKVLQNKRVGDEITLHTPKGDRSMKVEAIKY